MVIIIKKGELEKLNKNILERRKTYTVAEYPCSNLTVEAEEALSKIFEKIDKEK